MKEKKKERNEVRGYGFDDQSIDSFHKVDSITNIQHTRVHTTGWSGECDTGQLGN